MSVPELASTVPQATRSVLPRPGAASRKRVWLLRHAEVHEDWQGRAYGDLDVPLSALGLERTVECARAFARLAPSVVLSSPLQRAIELGSRIAEAAGVEVRLDDGLREIHRGAWQGLAVERLLEEHADDVGAFYRDPWTWRGHGGECDRMVADRAWPVVERAVEFSPQREIVVTTHYNVIRILTASALGVGPARSFALRVDPGNAVALVDGEEGWELHALNVHAPNADTDA